MYGIYRYRIRDLFALYPRVAVVEEQDEAPRKARVAVVVDIVVTVGTAVSSLAGAVGKKCLLLAKRSWIFLGETERYPWYPTVHPLLVQDHELVATRIPDAASMI